MTALLLVALAELGLEMINNILVTLTHTKNNSITMPWGGRGGHDVHDKTSSIIKLHMHARLPPLILINDPGNAAVSSLLTAILGSADVPSSKSGCLAPLERIGTAGHAAG